MKHSLAMIWEFGMSLSRKSVNFDLSTRELKKHFTNTAEAYNQIKDFMLENGFEHRQYSGYVSKESMSDKQVLKIIEKFGARFEWLSTCVQRFDVTEVGEQYDLTHIFTDKAPHKQQNIEKLEKHTTLKKQEALKKKISGFAQSKKTQEKSIPTQER